MLQWAARVSAGLFALDEITGLAHNGSVATFLHWAAFAIQILTCWELLRRRMALRLPFFSVFLFAVTAQHFVLGLNFTTGRYVPIQSALAPWMAVLQAAAGVEAFWWFVSTLPRFRRIGVVVLALFAAGSIVTERLSAPGRSVYDATVEAMKALERGVSFSLGSVLIAALILFWAIGTPKVPKWHAACLASLSFGNALAWQMMSFKTAMCSMILAFSVWFLRVDEAPTWITPEPKPYDKAGVDAAWASARDSITEAKDAVKRAAGR